MGRGSVLRETVLPAVVSIVTFLLVAVLVALASFELLAGDGALGGMSRGVAVVIQQALLLLGVLLGVVVGLRVPSPTLGAGRRWALLAMPMVVAVIEFAAQPEVTEPGWLRPAFAVLAVAGSAALVALSGQRDSDGARVGRRV